jgi:hypothetical protein
MMATAAAAKAVRLPLREAYAGYSEEEQPLAQYAALAALFNVGYAALVVAGRSRLPARYALEDVLLVGVAAHKLSRLLAKDRVTSFLRAPFTRYVRAEGHGEIEEEARGTGMRRAVGELAVCPYCLGLWVSGGLSLGLVHAPRVTRLAALTLAGLTVSDVLQLAYRAAEDAA